MAQPVVAVVNTNPDVVELLKARIEAAGYAWGDLPRYLETARADGHPEP